MSKVLRVFKVGICGAGVVGGGVVEIIKRQRPLFQKQGFDFVVKTIATKDAQCHGFEPEAVTRVSANLDDVTKDWELDIVVEAMGGIEPAKTIFRDTRAHVVTANKALLADSLPELEKMFLRNPRKRHGKRLGYEAAVAGGVPIIRAMQQSLLPDTITGVAGIMNGTTNFILSKMDSEGKPYAEVLRQAQEAGYAEADPTADVEGHDARNKLTLLTRLATGLYVHPSHIRTTGITSVSDWDFAAWKDAGCTIKLLGSMEVFEGAPKSKAADAGAEAAADADGAAAAPAAPAKLLDLWVSPVVIKKSSAFGITSGAMNLVRVKGENTGVTSYYGAGAGRFPTANSIVADMVNIAKGSQCVPPFPRPSPKKQGFSLKQSGALQREWYLRGPQAAIELASVALWRQGHAVSPVGPAAGPTKAFTVTGVSHDSLSALLRRVAAKTNPDAPLPHSGIVCFPVVSEMW